MKKFATITILGFVLFATVHIVFTLLYVLPQEFVPKKLNQKSNAYMSPLFHQGWALFAPAPKVNKKVFVSYLQNDNTWSPWQAAFNEYKQNHLKYRFAGYGKLVLMQSSTLHKLYYENEEKFAKQSVIKGDINSGVYRVLKYEVEKEFLVQEKNLKQIRMLVQFSSTDKIKSRKYIYYSH